MIITKKNIAEIFKTDLKNFCAKESLDNFICGHYKFDILPWLELPYTDRKILLKLFGFTGYDDPEDEYYMIFVTDNSNTCPEFYLIVTDFPFEYYDIERELADAYNTEQLFYRFDGYKIEI